MANAMEKHSFEAVFDGEVFRPIQPIKLRAGTIVCLKITDQKSVASSFLDVAQSLKLEGPPDWSESKDTPSNELRPHGLSAGKFTVPDDFNDPIF
jgi:predicted DNA-binding antitoxin AbrB/MazE fold protein